MIEWLKETLVGLGCLLGLWLLAMIYNIFNKISAEDSKRGEISREIGKYVWGVFLNYLIICSFAVPLIILIIWLFS